MRFVIVFLLLLVPASAQDIVEARFWKKEVTPGARPKKGMWKKARPVAFQHDWRGDPLVGHRTIIRARWTTEKLWLLIQCAFDTLTISPDPRTAKETEQLPSISDVVQVFIAPDPDDILRYKAFQVIPVGQWMDLHIDRETDKYDAAWNSGVRSRASIDNSSHMWWAELAIPLKAFGVSPPANGTRWRLNVVRIEHGPPPRSIAWQPTYTPQPNFHVPQVFGWLHFRR